MALYQFKFHIDKHLKVKRFLFLLYIKYVETFNKTIEENNLEQKTLIMLGRIKKCLFFFGSNMLKSLINLRFVALVLWHNTTCFNNLGCWRRQILLTMCCSPSVEQHVVKRVYKSHPREPQKWPLWTGGPAI